MQNTNLILLSGQMALGRTMDVVANNVANASTTGFKREGIEFNTYLNRPTAGKEGLNFVIDRATFRDAATGPIEKTSNPLDLALQGPGYFEVKQADGTTGYTRAGSFQLDTQGNLTTQSGQQVLGEGGQAIAIPTTASQINIGADGFVTARVDNGKSLADLGKVAVVKFDSEQAMQSVGNSTYTTQQTPQATTDTVITQGSLEKSNVEPVTEITNMLHIMRSYEQINNMISTSNQSSTTALDKLSKTTM